MNTKAPREQADGRNEGPYFVERNGRKVSPEFDTEGKAAQWAVANPAPRKEKRSKY